MVISFYLSFQIETFSWFKKYDPKTTSCLANVKKKKLVEKRPEWLKFSPCHPSYGDLLV